ncbi:MAG TPA: 3-hydroxyacyl-CoA dehydrogenase NAD-binding domain-containing protein, partial [Thermoanaerobaculia bacterium]
MIRQIAVIGSGTMGRGIAWLAANSGYDTVVFDLDQSALDAAHGWIESTFRKSVEKGKIAEDDAAKAMGRVQTVADLEPAVQQADLIIEAVPENFQLKADLFAQADLFCGEETYLVSNTSSISITRLASNVERRERFAGMHFFNPP